LVAFYDLLIFATHYRDVCNGGGGDLPQVTTNEESNVTSTSAQLNGTLGDTGGLSCEVRFEYGTTTSYGSSTSHQAKSTTGSFNRDISGLNCNTPYHFRACASNSEGTVYGADNSFMTSPCICDPPQVTTNEESNVLCTSARLNGNLTDTGDCECEVWFEYGTTTSYGSSTSHQAKSTTGSFNHDISGLNQNTTYHFRACASNDAGPDYGDDNTFTTPPCEATWTIMFYLDGDNDLEESYWWHNLFPIESVSSTQDVNIVVQMDPYDDCEGTYRYYVTGAEAGSTYPLFPDDIVETMPEQDMSDPTVLTDFINWAGDNYPADHYMLFTIDHGDGWREVDILSEGVLWDWTDGYTHMEIPEFAQSLADANINIDILCIKACLMQMIEVAWEISERMVLPPNYQIASENGAISGLPYNEFLTQIINNPDVAQSDICETIVNGYIDMYPSSPITMSALQFNAEFVNNTDNIINNFSNALMASAYQVEISNAKSNAQHYDEYKFKDLYDFAERIKINVPDCQSQAQAVMDLIDNIIIAEAHNTSAMQDSHGLSIYIPDSTSGYNSNYDTLQFAIDTQWDEFLLYTPDIVPPTVTTLPADNITPNSATVHGSIDATGGEEPFDGGFDVKLKSGVLETTVKIGVGNYYADLGGLTPETTYEFRIWAENSAGIGYGDWLEFTTLPPVIVPPTVTTRYADNFTPNSATVHGRIDDTGGEEPFDARFEYKVQSMVESKEITVEYPVGNYYYDLTGLSPDTTYEYRFRAENSAGIGYGDWLDFTTLPIFPPTVTTLNASNYTQTSAIAWFEINDTGGEEPFRAGVYYRVKSIPTYSESETEVIDSNGTKIEDSTETIRIEAISETESTASTEFYFGEENEVPCNIMEYGVGVYKVTLTDLSCGTPYEFRGFAENSAGEGTGSYHEFSTSDCTVVPPTVSRGPLYDHSDTEVKAYGTIEATGGENPWKAGMFIEDLTLGTDPHGYYKTGDYQAGDEYYIIIPDLVSGHDYSYRAYAENTAGKGYSSYWTFTKP